MAVKSGLATAAAASPELKDRLDLDGRAQRQLAHPERAAGVPAGFPEDLDEQVGGSVDHGGLLVETGRRLLGRALAGRLGFVVGGKR